MENDLISRAAALDVLVTSPNFHTTLTRIEELPAVDAAPVVRCKDCKYFEFISDRPVRHGNCKISDDKWAEDSFCSAGERKKIDGRMKND